MTQRNEKLVNFRKAILGCETQREFAKKTGIALPTIKKLERGSVPSLGTLIKIYNATALAGYQTINILEFFK